MLKSSKAVSQGKGVTNDTLDGSKRSQHVTLYDSAGTSVDIVDDVQEALEPSAVISLQRHAEIINVMTLILQEMQVLNAQMRFITDLDIRKYDVECSD